jgi:RimJ/RimL family protein N-acetyltransferase
MFSSQHVSYWLGKAFRGKGLASAGLAAFLQEVTVRPLQARVVHDNAASLRVLEKCGFRISDDDTGFAAGRGEAVREVILTLE